MNESERLARIETRLDTLTTVMAEVKDYMERIVRMEMRHTQTDGAIQRMGKSIDDLEERVHDLETCCTKGQVNTRIIERSLWVLVTGILSAILAKLKGVI